MSDSRIEAVVFDWAGTTVDFGSRGPTAVFLEIFRRRGVAITAEEARGPMGRAKRDHIDQVMKVARVAAEWEKVHKQAPTSADVDSMYEEFLPLQKSVLSQHSDVIPGVVETVAALRRRGIRIGSTTGYTRELMDIVEPLAREQGYAPDVVLTTNDVPAGRPAPWMNVRAAEALGVIRFQNIVAVDDTPVGLQAARNGGMWAVGVSRTGNALGLSEVEVAALDSAELRRRLDAIERDFRQQGAQFVVESVADLPAVLEEIESRLRATE
jgi:phosphonoacetaldehyde hydrolase